MASYRFITHDCGDHIVEIECPDNKAARKEARKAFSDAAYDALADVDRSEMTMTVETGGRTIFRARFEFSAEEQA